MSEHERTPVVLSPASFATWLDPLTPKSAVADLLRSCSAGWLDIYSVASGVGNVRNDGPQLIAPIEAVPST